MRNPALFERRRGQIQSIAGARERDIQQPLGLSSRSRAWGILVGFPDCVVKREPTRMRRARDREEQRGGCCMSR